MTALELTNHTAQMLGYDGADDLDEGPRRLIRQYLDQAVAQAAQDRCLPLTHDRVTLDDTGCAAEGMLTYAPLRVVSVTVDGAERPFRRIRLLMTPVIQVPGAAGQEADITYGFTPPPLDNEDEPPFPAWFHPHLADYAAARMLGQGGSALQNKARFFMEIWYTALARLTGPEHDVTGWRHLYRR